MPQFFRNILLPLFIFLQLHSIACADEVTAAKVAAIERYRSAVPISKLINDLSAALAKQVPAEQQEQFVRDMRLAMPTSAILEISKQAMIKTFTLEELNALADFYQSPAGASAMSKMGAFIGEAMPQVIQEMQRSVDGLHAKRANKQLVAP